MKRGVNLQRDYREDAITGGSESAANTPHVEAKLAYSRDQRLRAMVQLRAPHHGDARRAAIRIYGLE